jgi:hypothetical protein
MHLNQIGPSTTLCNPANAYIMLQSLALKFRKERSVLPWANWQEGGWRLPQKN